VEQAEDQPDRHAGVGNFLADARAALHVADAARGRRRRRRRRDGADRKGLGRGRASDCRAWSSLNRLDRDRASLDARWRRCASRAAAR
jgi:hypothetical protein